MKRKLQYRLLFALAVFAVSIYFFYPPSEKVKLGLDLKGGIHLVLQVIIDDALKAEAHLLRDRLARALEEGEAVFQEIRVNPQLEIEILGVPEESADVVEGQLDGYSGGYSYRTRFNQGRQDFTLGISSAYRKELANLTVRQARETIQNRVDQYGVAEPTITVYGSGEVQDQIIVELPGVEDPDRVIKLIRSTARLELKLVHPARGGPHATRQAAEDAFDGSVPGEYEILPYRNPSEIGRQTQHMVVRRAATISGQHMKNARRTQDSFTGRWNVTFFLNSEGRQLFAPATEQNVGNPLAIVLDGEIRTFPNISEKIDTESAQITGNYTPEEAEDLALVLRSGALPASIRIIENQIVGPSLGMDSIRSGLSASALGLLLVMVAVLFIYRFSGVNAVVCLILNLVILVGVLAYFRATLTLPGIAGIILTIGMAIDANILIFERIKEELRLGKTVRSGVEAAFGRVFITILDTNITTLIGSLFLFQFGTGPIRGFAVTLSVGLVANIFTATFVSRTLFGLILQGKPRETLSI
jgi:preprotein translocase subunit SecD